MVSLNNDMGLYGAGVASNCLMLSSEMMGQKNTDRASKAGGGGTWALD